MTLLAAPLRTLVPTVRTGAIAVLDHTASLSDCSLHSNVAWLRGGALEVASKTFVSLSDCSLHSNSAGDAGAIAVEENAHFTARACRFRGNQAVDKQGSGGAINVEAYSSLELADSSFSADDAARGAGIFARPSSQVSIANTSFSDYLAGGRSGAVILIMDD